MFGREYRIRNRLINAYNKSDVSTLKFLIKRYFNAPYLKCHVSHESKKDKVVLSFIYKEIYEKTGKDNTIIIRVRVKRYGIDVDIPEEHGDVWIVHHIINMLNMKIDDRDTNNMIDRISDMIDTYIYPISRSIMHRLGLL